MRYVCKNLQETEGYCFILYIQYLQDENSNTNKY